MRLTSNLNSLVKKIIFFGLFFLVKTINAQTDTEFWFSVPEINRYHTGGNDVNHSTLGGPTYLRLTAGKIGTRFWISMPANSTNFNGGVQYTDSIPPFSTITIDLLDKKFVGDDNLTAPFGEHPLSTMENRLKWTTSDIAPTTVKKYINKNKKGVYIKSAAPITAYYEISSKANMELLALKGKNALGTEFYVPFQTTYNTTNQYNTVNHQYIPYHSFDIVATEDNTEIEITPTDSVFIYPNSFYPKATFRIWLNKGETAIIPPYSTLVNKAYKVPYSNTRRLDGSRVRVISGGKIAIITRDDLVNTPNGVDFVGDQLVPLNILGLDYAVIRGQLAKAVPGRVEQIYVFATQSNTKVEVNGALVTTLINPGDSWVVTVTEANVVTNIHTDKPSYVFHHTGFTDNDAGTWKSQAAAAIVPTITVCTGSSKVGFNRTKANVPGVGYYNFYINILVRDGAETKFKLTDKNGLDVTALIPGLNTASNYTLLGATAPFNQWRWATFAANTLNAGFDEAYMLSNSLDVFHLGVLNGFGGYDAFYGYFSDFNAFNPSSYVIGTGSSGTKECYGNDIQLYASGGTVYSWTPTDFLDNPQSDVPKALDVKYSVDYKVTISGACGFSADRIVKLFVSDYVSPAFSPDKFSACASKVNPADPVEIPSATFTFTDASMGDYYRKWFYRTWNKVTNTMNPWVEFKRGNDLDPDPANVVTQSFQNSTSDTIRYHIMLEIADDQEICFKYIVNSIVVYPYININPTYSTLDPNHCQPFLVNFQANPIGNFGSAYYNWDFGDGGTSASPTPSHTYVNTSTGILPFNASLKITDQWNYCSVTKPISINVQPYIKASFVANIVEGCYPFSTAIINDSKAAATASYSWDRDGNGSYETTAPGNWTFIRNTNPPVNDPDTVTIRLKVENAGCKDSTEHKIIINPRATANVTHTIVGDPACAPLEVDFNATTTNASIYHWMIDGTAVDNVTSTSYFFDNFGSTPVIKPVTFTANNQWGCSASAGPIDITVNPFVQAVLAIDDEEGCSPHTVIMTNASSPGSSSFEWDILNDGSIDFGTKNIGLQTYTYPVAMNNTFVAYSVPVKLTARNSAGCTDVALRTIKVNPQATASFVYDLNGNTNACSPVNVNFYGTYTNAQFYQWQFGDLGASTVENPFFQLVNTSNAVKTVQVDLVASNRFGCNSATSQTINVQPEIKADFSLSNSASCAPFTFNVSAPPLAAGTYSWQVLRGAAPFFSGSANSYPINVTDNKTGATEIYSVTLTASNGMCTATSPTKLVLAYPEVEAKWSLPDPIAAACSPLNLNITNQSTLYNSATVLTDVIWEITDGGSFNISSINPNVNQQLVNSGYELPKNYTLKLTARSADGCTAVKSSPIVVNPPVNAAFNASVIDACTPMRLQFTDASQTKSGTPYIWNLDGGSVVPNVGQNYTVDYTNPDPELAINKTVTLNLTNEYGCPGSASYSFTVNPRVVAALAVDATSSDNICAPDAIIFKNNSTGGTLSFKWDFGDGLQEIVNHRNNVTHSYENKTASPIARTVTLTATNSIGCTNAVPATIPVTIFPEIVPDFTFIIDSICTPVRVTITNNSLNGTDFQWNFTPSAGAPIVVNNLKANSPFTQFLGNVTPNSDVTYTIGLTASTNHGTKTCTRTSLTKTVTVLPELKLNFAPIPAAVCSDLPINFDNLSSGGTLNYTWDFNDGQSGASAGFDDVQHVFINRDLASITRNVTVTAVNPKGCTRKQFIPVTVHPKVEAGFVFEQLSQCTPFDVRITNNSLNGNSFSWTTTYNGNRITTDKNPFNWTIDNATSNVIQNETIKLISTDINTGCKAEVEHQIEVYPRVVSLFNVNRSSNCNPSTVNFSNLSSGLGSYVWDFGDGSTSVDQTPAARSYSHVYKDKTQDFTIKLTATNKFGCYNQKDTTITVYPLVKTNFQWDKIEGCTPLTVNLTNTSTSALYKYRWDFGDGTSKSYIEQPTSHTFVNSTQTPPVVQNPTITLRTSYVNDSTCIDSLKLPITVFPHIYPDFTTNFQGCHPHNVTINNQTVSVNSSNNYFWNLGNGVNSLEANPSIQYINTSKTKDSTFTVKLKAISIYGCKDSITHNVIVHPRPFASMELTGEYISCPPFPVEIDNNSIGTNLTNVYTFGDGYDSTTTSMANMRHTFHNLNSSNTEPYQIQLKTVTEFGCDDSISQTVYVYPEVVAKYNANPGWAACNPFEVTLQNTSTNAYLYRWNFDNGVTSSLPSPKHRFVNLTENDKVYNVSLEATSEFDCYDDTIQRITVWATPVAHIALDPALKVFPDATFNVYNQSIPAASDWSYSWTFNDNTFSNQKDPGTHTYHSWGPKSNDYKYNVSLVVKSPNCKDSTSSFVYLLPAIPEAFFTSNIDSACAPMEVHFINASNYADSYTWEFGDGTTSNDPEPIHTYTEPGYYTVKLTVNGDGGQRFYYRIFRVYQNPKADFQVYPVRVMLPDASVHAFNTSTSFTRCLWDMGDGFQTSDRDPIHTYTKIGEFRIALWAYMDYMDKNNNIVATCIDSVSKFPAVWVEGSGLLKFPNAFKPSKIENGGVYDDLDYKNEVFHPHHYGVVEYKLMIFSRWGEQIFTSTDVKVGWDGFVNGKLAEQGVYMWRAIGKFTNGKTFDMKGSVTLLR